MFLCSYTLTIVVHQFDCVNHLQGCMQLAVHIELRARSTLQPRLQRILLASAGKKLIRSYPTRWNSTFLMVEHLLLVKDGLGVLL